MICSITKTGLRITALVAVLAVCCAAQLRGAELSSIESSTECEGLEEGFRTPPDSVKPWVYWWWLNGNVTEESINRDLGEMKRKGIGGLLLFDSRGYHVDLTPMPPAKIEFMGSEWRRLLRFSLAEARRLGLSVSVNLSSTAGALAGPWNVGNDAPKKLVWSTQEVVGPTRFNGPLSSPEGEPLWDIAVVAVRCDQTDYGKKIPNAERVIDITGKYNSQERLIWDAPPGRWKVLRFAYTLLKGHERDVDILDANAVEGHFQRMGTAILTEAGPPGDRALTHFYSVSWEGGSPTWTAGFDKQFEARCRYDLRIWLPALAGVTIADPELTQRFRRDYYKTLGDLFCENYYGKLRELCHSKGLKWHSESGGPWNRENPLFKHADQIAFLSRNDMPQGEFWVGLKAMNRPAAMAAHVYDLPLAATEAFTIIGPHWREYPAILKPDADAAFCNGTNFLIWHTFTASPREFGKPGIEYFAGTHFNPNVTWWEQSGAFLKYLARCQLLLRQGRFVADLCYYTGDNPYMHWDQKTKRFQQPSLKLGDGYNFDLLSTEVLLSRLSVEDGDLVLPDGMRYRAIVVDLQNKTILPEALVKILALARAGATVVLSRRIPDHAPGLKGYPTRDRKVVRLVGKLWGAAGVPSGICNLGKGKVAVGMDLDAVLQAKNILPDFAGPWNYIHRRIDETEIYFLAGNKGQAECVFRVRGKMPELWDPTTGRVADAICYRETEDGRTVVPIRFSENGSMFVVFRRPADGDHLVSVSGLQDGGLEIDGHSADDVRVCVWRQGKYALETAGHKRLTVAVPSLPQAFPLKGPWEVRFAAGWGAPASITFDRLVPWNEHANEGIKFFSGTATYRKSFELTPTQAGMLVRLQLGEVKNIAEVRLNGRSLGVVWTAPWRVDLTGIVKPGKNDLEIDVTNTWQNRLIGDATLHDEEKRFTKTNVRRPYNYKGKHPILRGYSAKDSLVPSGLFGPVHLEFGQGQTVQF